MVAHVDRAEDGIEPQISTSHPAHGQAFALMHVAHQSKIIGRATVAGNLGRGVFMPTPKGTLINANIGSDLALNMR